MNNSPSQPRESLKKIRASAAAEQQTLSAWLLDNYGTIPFAHSLKVGQHVLLSLDCPLAGTTRGLDMRLII